MTNERALADALEMLQSLFDAAPIDGGAATPCRDFDVDGLVEHIIDTHWFLVGAAGGDVRPAVGSAGERHAAAAAASLAAWTARGTDGMIHLGPNELPAALGASIHLAEAYVHAWDLAAATGLPFDPSPSLTEATMTGATMFLTDDVRGTESESPYGPAIEVGPEATDVERLIAFTGRDPHWQAAPVVA